jgi:alkanesulfonate monooxygenase SsuD/methylene tetrahydromethanopterin reductase-like flavin-dependent oxidoreductase (luciferase family)
MSNSHLSPLFGISIDPSATDPQEPFIRARIADQSGLDLITLMDHPYNAKLFDTWTLMTALAVTTERVHVGTNVANLPLRPPAMLAKMAASLDVLTGGRVELGVGAGAYWDGVAAYGGPRRAAGEAYQAFEEALQILRGMWENAGGSFSYAGEIYQVRGARPGPAPAHPIRIWVGAGGPRMLRLVGRMADGLLVSYNHVNPQKLLEFNRRIDAGAQAAGRAASEIRRGYNLMGVLNTGRADTTVPGLKAGYLNGSVQDWAEQIADWYEGYRQDTFIFWPVAGNQQVQIETFAREVVPKVKETLA